MILPQNLQEQLSGNKNMSVILEGYIEVLPQELEMIRDNLDIHIKNTKKEKGCMEFSVRQDISNKYIFHVFEKFTDDEAFLYHQDRVKKSNWGKVSKNVKRFYKINKSNK